MILENLLESTQLGGQKIVDWHYAIWPRRSPSPTALAECRLVAHRGDCQGGKWLENTLPAFDSAAQVGVWGLELDIRWSADLVPMVIHDLDTLRVFGRKVEIGRLTQKQIRHEFPLIPTLEEVIVRYGGKQHLMIEIKAEHYPNPSLQMQRLKELTGSMREGEDFHFLALAPELFKYVDFAAKKTLLPIAEMNVRQLSQISLENNYGGLTGHYLLLSPRLQRRHQQAGQGFGTGFISSPNCLIRELNRGVDWIFSNQAVALQKWLEQKLASA